MNLSPKLLDVAHKRLFTKPSKFTEHFIGCSWRKFMKGTFLRWLILTVAIIITSYLLDGIRIGGFSSALFAAAILGILNAFFRPILLILTLPINILTLGIFTFVINAIMLMMVSGVISGFEVSGFWSAVFGSLLISLVSSILTSFVNERGAVQYIDLKKIGDNRWE
jgi:putative membrane protein